MEYLRLFAPGKIGNLNLKNHIVHGPMEFTASGYNGELTDEVIEYYEQSAKAGTGLIITGYGSMEEIDSGYSLMLLTNRKHITTLSKLARRIHKYGAKVIVQVFMGANPDITTEELKEAVKKFGFSARILYDAGIDGIEVLAAGGSDYFMINHLMSPCTNQRQDEYGGCFDNRMKFLKEIIEEIRNQCPKDFTVGVRFTADEFLDGGYGLEEGILIAKRLESYGVDYLNVQNSHQGKQWFIIEPVNVKFGWKSYILEAIKDAVAIPVMGTCVIKKPEQAEELLEKGIVDFPVTCRMFLADVSWPKKAKQGKGDEIKTCIGCLHCIDTTELNQECICAVNPTVLRNDEFIDKGKDLEGKKIVVVGAGPAGMEAAILCAQRGANVTVFEKRPFIGGAAKLGSMTPDKEPLEWFVKYYETMARKLEIDVRLNSAVSKDEIISMNPYAVFVATGATPIVLPTGKPDGIKIFTVDQVLESLLEVKGKNIV